MSFESRVMVFSERFLSDRAFRLIVEPALADLQFDEERGRRCGVANRLAVLRAVAGGFRLDFWRDSGSLLKMLLMSLSYHMFPLAVGIEYFKTWSEFFAAMLLVTALSLVPVMVCYWPPRQSARSVE